MKKFIVGFGLVGLVFLLVIYYFFLNSKALNAKIEVLEAEIKMCKSMVEVENKDIFEGKYPDNANFIINSNKYVDLGAGYFKYKKNIYYINGSKKIKLNLDVNSFEIINLPYYFMAYIKDENNMYFRDKRMGGVNINDFKFIDDSKRFIESNNNIYCHGEILVNATPSKFTFFKNMPYAKDKNNLYYFGEIEGCENYSENINIDSLNFLDSFYAKDLTNVWEIHNSSRRLNTIIENADIETFEVLKNGYAKDKNHIYVKSEYPNENVEILEKADLTSFKVLNKGYAIDKNNCYKKIEIVPMSECDEITETKKKSNIDDSGYYTKDDEYVYFEGEKLRESNPLTFEILTEGFARDDDNIYYQEKSIEEANVNTFEIFDCGYAKDNRYIYYKDKTISEEPETFKVLNRCYAKTENTCYEKGEKVLMYDCAQFE